jgi:hypothetical protein
MSEDVMAFERNLESRVENDQNHFAECHRRWRQVRNRDVDSPDTYEDSWFETQCGGCRFFVRLTGVFSEDYGACTNEMSKCDGLVRFEHDGCEEFVAAKEGW